MLKRRQRQMCIRDRPVTHPHIYENTLQLHTLRVRHEEDDVLYVRGEGTVSHEKADGLLHRIDLFRDELEKKAGVPVVVEVEAIPVNTLRFRAAPDGYTAQGAAPTPKIGER